MAYNLSLAILRSRPRPAPADSAPPLRLSATPSPLHAAAEDETKLRYGRVDKINSRVIYHIEMVYTHVTVTVKQRIYK
jgi:hypothetical protein